MNFRQTIISAVALLAICGSVIARADEPAPYVDEDAVREAAINQHITSTCKEFSSAILKGERPEKAGLFCQETHLQLGKFRSEIGLPPAAPITLEEKASLEQSEQQIAETCTAFMQDVVNQVRTEETRSKLQGWLKSLEEEDLNQSPM